MISMNRENDKATSLQNAATTFCFCAAASKCSLVCCEIPGKEGSLSAKRLAQICFCKLFMSS